MTNYTTYEIEKLINFCLGYLRIPEVDIYVMYNDSILDRFSSKDIEIEALLYKNPIKSSYNLYVRKNLSNIKNVICHEMIHLKQYEDNRLYLDYKTGIFTWEGEEYKDIPYFERKWEKEAFSKERKLIKAYKLSAKKCPLS